jgi:hypothetical protein
MYLEFLAKVPKLRAAGVLRNAKPSCLDVFRYCNVFLFDIRTGIIKGQEGDFLFFNSPK